MYKKLFLAFAVIVFATPLYPVLENHHMTNIINTLDRLTAKLETEFAGLSTEQKEQLDNQIDDNIEHLLNLHRTLFPTANDSSD